MTAFSNSIFKLASLAVIGTGIAHQCGILQVNGNVIQIKWEGKLTREIPVRTFISGIQFPMLSLGGVGLLCLGYSFFASRNKPKNEHKRDKIFEFAVTTLALTCLIAGSLELLKRALPN